MVNANWIRDSNTGVKLIPFFLRVALRRFADLGAYAHHITHCPLGYPSHVEAKPWRRASARRPHRRIWPLHLGPLFWVVILTVASLTTGSVRRA